VDVVTAVQEALPARLTVFPNPAAGKLTVRTDGKPQSIRLSDLNGRDVLVNPSPLPGENILKTECLVPGLYILTVEMDSWIRHVKITVVPG
jgi:hypothetical protein